MTNACPPRAGAGRAGVDGDPVDVFVGPNARAALASVFHMARLGVGGYDEDNIAVGFATREDAERCLRVAYNRPGLFDSAPRRLTVPELAAWLRETRNRGRKMGAGRELHTAVTS